MKNEDGYVLIVTIVIICIITFSILVLTNRTVTASIFALRRADTVKALSLAESAALEGIWQLQNDPSYRTTQKRYWTDGHYQYSIEDETPATVDDLDLAVVGEGFVNDQTRKIRVKLHRDDTDTQYAIVYWQQLN